MELTIQDSSDANSQKPDALQFGGDSVFYLSDFNSKKDALQMGLGFAWMPGFLIEPAPGQGRQAHGRPVQGGLLKAGQ